MFSGGSEDIGSVRHLNKGRRIPSTIPGLLSFSTGTMSDYIELLKHPNWQKRRLQIFERDEWCCTECFDQFTNLQVHHLYYLPNTLPWDYPDDAFKTLCDLCHKKVEFYKWVFRHIEYNLFELQFNSDDIISVRNLICRRVRENKHRDSVLQYMEDLKKLIHG